MHNNTRARNRASLRLTVFAAVLGLASAGLAQPIAAQAALPKTAPAVIQKTAANVTADALPTAQINGVVWTQVVVGNTVFAGGDFSEARPAGAAPGVDAVTRPNLMSYRLSTGEMTSFAPMLDGEVRALAVTPDKTTLLVGGDFTKVGEANRLRYAAFDIASGKLLAAAPAFNGRVNAIVVVGSKAYVGGWFTTVGTKARMHLAAVSVKTGTVSSWAPTTNNSVNALVATPDKTKMVVGGAFSHINTTKVRGMAPVGISSGKPSTWKINKVVKDYAPKSAILSLAADKDTIYGSGFAYGGGNFEGTFAASPKDGAVKWLQDCHGDTYSVAPLNGIVYAVGHAHHCSNIGSFGDTVPRVRWQRALAMTTKAKGTVQTNSQPGKNYGNFAGYPAPALINWFPRISAANYSGMTQGAWSVVGNSKYVALGGEFPAVNGVPQQGLVRFAVFDIAPNKMGPALNDASTSPQLTINPVAGVTVDWVTNSDPDDRKLRYEVLRDGVEITSVSAISYFWDRRKLTFADNDVKPEQTYEYAIRAVDPDGNEAVSPVTTVTVPKPYVAAEKVEPDATPEPEATPTPTLTTDPEAAPVEGDAAGG